MKALIGILKTGSCMILLTAGLCAHVLGFENPYAGSDLALPRAPAPFFELSEPVPAAEQVMLLRSILNEQTYHHTVTDALIFDSEEWTEVMLSLEMHNLSVVNSVKEVEAGEVSVSTLFEYSLFSSMVPRLDESQLDSTLRVLRHLAQEDVRYGQLVEMAKIDMNWLATLAAEEARKNRVLERVGEEVKRKLGEGWFDFELIDALNAQDASNTRVIEEYKNLDDHLLAEDVAWLGLVINGMRNNLSLATGISEAHVE